MHIQWRAKKFLVKENSLANILPHCGKLVQTRDEYSVFHTQCHLKATTHIALLMEDIISKTSCVRVQILYCFIWMRRKKVQKDCFDPGMILCQVNWREGRRENVLEGRTDVLSKRIFVNARFCDRWQNCVTFDKQRWDLLMQISHTPIHYSACALLWWISAGLEWKNFCCENSSSENTSAVDERRNSNYWSAAIKMRTCGE